MARSAFRTLRISIIRDNAITNFGRDPGISRAGSLFCIGEMVEISRNHVLETRDWTRQQKQAEPAGLRGGIVLFLVTPPAFPTANPYADPTGKTLEPTTAAFLPNLPALRVEHNTVRVALGNALEALGYGPFSIVNNHLATGGSVRTESRSLAETVQILNVAPSIESQTLAKYSNLINSRGAYLKGGRGTSNPSCGAVLFTDNICQLEARVSHQRTLASVLILGLDDLIFSNNACWVDGARGTAVADAVLVAGSLQVTSNRFQEAAGFPVGLSTIEFGVLNITSLNISTYPMLPLGFQLVNTNNLVV